MIVGSPRETQFSRRALLLGGGLVALQAMAVSTGFPFTVVLLIATVSVVKGLASEPR